MNTGAPFPVPRRQHPRPARGRTPCGEARSDHGRSRRRRSQRFEFYPCHTATEGAAGSSGPAMSRADHGCGRPSRDQRLGGHGGAAAARHGSARRAGGAVRCVQAFLPPSLRRKSKPQDRAWRAPDPPPQTAQSRAKSGFPKRSRPELIGPAWARPKQGWARRRAAPARANRPGPGESVGPPE
jgi:hypothetical protein